MDEQDRLQLVELRADVQHLISVINELKARFNGHVTTETFNSLKDRVDLIQKTVFGGVAVALISILGAVIGLVIKK